MSSHMGQGQQAPEQMPVSYYGASPPNMGAQQPVAPHSNRYPDDDVGSIPGLGNSSSRPPWLIPVVVGVAALLVGGGIAILALAR